MSWFFFFFQVEHLLQKQTCASSQSCLIGSQCILKGYDRRVVSESFW